MYKVVNRTIGKIHFPKTKKELSFFNDFFFINELTKEIIDARGKRWIFVEMIESKKIESKEEIKIEEKPKKYKK